MKKLLLFFLLFLILPITHVLAQNSDSSIKVYRIESDEIVDHDVFAAAERVEIEGTVNGDVYAAAGQVYISGTINGDLLVAGGQINISGDVSQNLRLAGGNINISGTIGRNASLAAGNVDFTGEGEIVGGLAAAFGNLNLTSPVGKYVKVAGGNLTIANNVGGDVEAAIGSIRLTPNANISGNMTYWSNEKSSVDDTRVGGRVYFNRTEEGAESKIRNAAGKAGGAVSIGSFIFTLIMGIAFLLFFPKFTMRASDFIKTRPLKSFLFGLLSIFIFTLVFIVLAVTILGIPLALLLALLYCFSLYLARIPVIYLIGSLLMGRFGEERQEIWSLVAGLIMYWILILLPVKPLVTFLVTFTGFGGAYLALKSRKTLVLKTVRKSRKA